MLIRKTTASETTSASKTREGPPVSAARSSRSRPTKPAKIGGESRSNIEKSSRSAITPSTKSPSPKIQPPIATSAIASSARGTAVATLAVSSEPPLRSSSQRILLARELLAGGS